MVIRIDSRGRELRDRGGRAAHAEPDEPHQRRAVPRAPHPMVRWTPRRRTRVDQGRPARGPAADQPRIRRPHPHRAPRLIAHPGRRNMPAARPARDRRPHRAMHRPTGEVLRTRVAPPQQRHGLCRRPARGERHKHRVPEVVEDRRALGANRGQERRANGTQELRGRMPLRRASGHGKSIVASSRTGETKRRPDRLYRCSGPASKSAEYGQI